MRIDRRRMSCFSFPLSLLASCLIFGYIGPLQAQEVPEMTLATEDGNFSVTFSADFQIRYELLLADGEAQHSSIFIRRLQPMVDGNAFGDALTFRVVPEVAREASLRDGWVAYQFHRALGIRAGQYAVPFHWERDASSDYHQFVERSVANNEFQWADGRDIGLTLFGEPLQGLHYDIGIFSGQGQNAARADTAGHLIATRISGNILGEYHERDAMVEPVVGVNLLLGAGAYAGLDNTVDDWARFNLLAPAQPANVLATTADAHLEWGRIGLHLSAFYRDVSPASTPEEIEPSRLFDPYQGFGYSTQVGVLAIARRLLLVARYSHSSPNLDVDSARQYEALLGAQIFHRGHASKLHVEAGQLANHDGSSWQDEQILRLQYQLLF